MTRPAPNWGALQGAIAGDVVLPGLPGYEPARKPAIARFHDARPQAVVLCETSEDVSEGDLVRAPVRVARSTAERGALFLRTLID